MCHLGEQLEEGKQRLDGVQLKLSIISGVKELSLCLQESNSKCVRKVLGETPRHGETGYPIAKTGGRLILKKRGKKTGKTLYY